MSNLLEVTTVLVHPPPISTTVVCHPTPQQPPKRLLQNPNESNLFARCNFKYIDDNGDTTGDESETIVNADIVDAITQQRSRQENNNNYDVKWRVAAAAAAASEPIQEVVHDMVKGQELACCAAAGDNIDVAAASTRFEGDAIKSKSLNISSTTNGIPSSSHNGNFL